VMNKCHFEIVAPLLPVLMASFCCFFVWFSPSQSEPDLANPTRWRSQRRIHDEPSADLRLVFLSTRTQQHHSHVCSSNNRDLWNFRSGTNNEHL
jgi:hypothetical protein